MRGKDCVEDALTSQMERKTKGRTFIDTLRDDMLVIGNMDEAEDPVRPYPHDKSYSTLNFSYSSQHSLSKLQDFISICIQTIYI